MRADLPLCHEDLERANATKTSSVHFLRFELTPAMITALHGGAGINAGINHDAYTIAATQLPPGIRDSLASDLLPGAIN